MKFINKQAAMLTLIAEVNEVYLPTTDAQIRALTVHNPTELPIDLAIAITGLLMVKKTITAGATEVISSLFNQQLKKDELLTMTGEGANVLITVVEITE